jgi:hypothetical protein
VSNGVMFLLLALRIAYCADPARGCTLLRASPRRCTGVVAVAVRKTFPVTQDATEHAPNEKISQHKCSNKKVQHIGTPAVKKNGTL